MLRNVAFYFELLIVAILGTRLLIPRACINLALISELRSFQFGLIERDRISNSLSKCSSLFKTYDHTQPYLPVRLNANPESATGWVNQLSGYVITHPKDMMAKKELAETLLEAGENEQAFQVYKTIATGIHFYSLGTRELRNKNLAKAEIYFSFAVKSKPEQAAWWFQLGEVQYHLGIPGARKSYLQVLNLPSPVDIKAMAHVRIGSLLASQKEFVAAADQYRSALTLDPHSWSAMVEMGRIYLSKGDVGEACLWYSLAEDEAPGNVWVRNLFYDIEKVSECKP